MPSILYIHGFNSSPASLKARQLTACMTHLGLADHLRAPALPNDAGAAFALLERELEELDAPLLVGSSLGGYYATVLAERHGLKAVLINPAVRPWRFMEHYLGPQRNHHTGETWTLTEAHVEALSAQEVAAPADPERFHVWLQTGDETLDYRDAERYYGACTLRIEQGGDHGFQGFHRQLPLLLELAGFDPALWRELDFNTFE